ncbi:hypothetical protein J6590_088033 [Homalodisca vitripennis]|nr:hypothetical protein J6590_088033 [Homalodisca vitripennis]
MNEAKKEAMKMTVPVSSETAPSLSPLKLTNGRYNQLVVLNIQSPLTLWLCEGNV